MLPYPYGVALYRMVLILVIQKYAHYIRLGQQGSHESAYAAVILESYLARREPWAVEVVYGGYVLLRLGQAVCRRVYCKVASLGVAGDYEVLIPVRRHHVQVICRIALGRYGEHVAHVEIFLPAHYGVVGTPEGYAAYSVFDGEGDRAELLLLLLAGLGGIAG